MMRTNAGRVSPWVLGALALGFVLAGGCASGSRSSSAEPAGNSPWEVRVESSLDSARVVATEADSARAARTAAEETPAPAQSQAPQAVVPSATAADSARSVPGSGSAGTVPTPRQFAPGWRVQIAALSSMETAEGVAEQARRKFTEPVYVEYEPPLYKVRVGDFLLREPAEALLTRAHAQGYSKAWVVETLVVRPR